MPSIKEAEDRKFLWWLLSITMAVLGSLGLLVANEITNKVHQLENIANSNENRITVMEERINTLNFLLMKIDQDLHAKERLHEQP